MIDITLFESGDGGDLFINNKDILATDSIIQTIYICLFGGNVEAITKGNEPKNEIREDWWGNFLLSDKKLFNSLTEKVLKETALNSNGRIKILNAVKEDLKPLSDVAKIDVDVYLPKQDTVKIIISVVNNQKNNIYEIIWDKMKQEPIITIPLI